MEFFSSITCVRPFRDSAILAAFLTDASYILSSVRRRIAVFSLIGRERVLTFAASLEALVLVSPTATSCEKNLLCSVRFSRR